MTANIKVFKPLDDAKILVRSIVQTRMVLNLPLSCPICGFYETTFDIDKTPIQNTEVLFDAGWRYAISFKDDFRGLFCPDCSLELTPESQG